MRFVLTPLSWIYGLVVLVRNFLFDSGFFRSEKFNIPVICVGNLCLGGSGKTPHVDYLITLLKPTYNVAILTRGYKRKSCGFLYVSDDSSALNVGDESLQIKKKHQTCVVAVNKNRKNGILKIIKDYPKTQVIILDDGFQHRWIKAGLNILLTNYKKPFYQNSLIPVGTLREHKSNKKRAEIVVVTNSARKNTNEEKQSINKKLALEKNQGSFFSSVKYQNWINLFNSSEIHTQSQERIVLVTGIARPKILKNYLEKNGYSVTHLIFPDHHIFSKTDINKILSTFDSEKNTKKLILTTEKDACRLELFKDSFLDVPLYMIPIEIQFEKKNKFNEIIKNYVKSNKRNC